MVVALEAARVYQSQVFEEGSGWVVFINNELVPTNTLILTFNRPTLLKSIAVGYINFLHVEPYIQYPLRCSKCYKFGHGQSSCRNKMCAHYGQFDNDSKVCKQDITC